MREERSSHKKQAGDDLWLEAKNKTDSLPLGGGCHSETAWNSPN